MFIKLFTVWSVIPLDKRICILSLAFLIASSTFFNWQSNSHRTSSSQSQEAPSRNMEKTRKIPFPRVNDSSLPASSGIDDFSVR